LKSGVDKKAVAQRIVENFDMNKTKFHLFAMTHLDILAEYEFYSADSTGWVLRASGFATLDTPMGYIRFGSRDSKKMSKTGVNLKRFTKEDVKSMAPGERKTYFVDDMNPKDRARLDAYLQSFGTSIELCNNTYRRSWVQRAYYQAKFFVKYEEACNKEKERAKDLGVERKHMTKFLDRYLQRAWRDPLKQLPEFTEGDFVD
jgi:hypothetical protein